MTSANEATEPEALHGVTLEAWATVHAALGEGMDEARALAAAGVEPSTWPAADDAWSERMSDDFSDDGPLQGEYDAHLHAAQARFARPLPPVDRELAPWLDLVRHFASAEEPIALLKTLGLRGAEMTRLHRAWSKRLGDEPGLRSEAAEILARPPGPLPELDLAAAPAPPAPLPPRVARGREKEERESDEGTDAPPPLFAPLPTEEDDEPSRPGEEVPMSVAPRTEAPMTRAPVTQEPVTQDPVTQDPVPPLSRIGAPFAPPVPAPVVPFAALPPAAPAPFAPPPVAPPPSSMVRPEPAPLTGRAALSSTAPIAYAPPRAAATPFAPAPAAGSPPRSASPLPFAAAGGSGSSSGAPAAPPPASVPAPPRASRPPGLDDTAPIASGLSNRTMMSSGGAAHGDAMPFSRRTPAPTGGSSPPSDLGHTAMLSGPVRIGAATPFREGPAPTPDELRKSVSLNVYAAICAELAVHPERAEAVFARYGLADPARRGAVDAMYKTDLARDPALRAKFEEIVKRAKAILI